MRRVRVSHKTLKWLVSVFIEASRTQGKVRRWKTREHFSELFCTLKYNENGRYISFIALQGHKKSIIITPECYYKGGWSNIAHKIAKFIYTTKEAEPPQTATTSKITGSFKEVCNTNRWATEASKKAHLQTTKSNISITGDTTVSEKDLLSRCLVGRFRISSQETKTPTLNEVRRWACNTWKVAGSLNVFAMNERMFLFELPSKKITEHILNATWSWKKMNLSLEWWNPTTGCWPEEITTSRQRRKRL